MLKDGSVRWNESFEAVEQWAGYDWIRGHQYCGRRREGAVGH